MKRSPNPTAYILIKASTISDWDTVDFAIITLTGSFRGLMKQRLLAVEQFRPDDSFHCLNYWDASCRFYADVDSKLYTDRIIRSDEEWAYINLDPGEEQLLFIPKNKLEGHQLMVTAGGLANFKAYSVGSFELYITESFSISNLCHRINN